VTRVAAVGHVEWVHFLHVDRLPLQGEITHAAASWEEPAGGATVAAVQLAKLAGGADFFTALGDDDLGRRVPSELDRYDVRVHPAIRDAPQRRAVTFLDAEGERTIIVIGERHGPSAADDLPWPMLEGIDGVYFTAGDEGALAKARSARVLVATSRVLSLLKHARLQLDVVIGSARDPSEQYEPIEPTPHLVLLTEGDQGGTYSINGGSMRRYQAAPLPGPKADSYGAGDSFAAGLTYGLAAGMTVEKAIDLAARCGAACVTGHGPYERQLTRADL
jgi:ribokinase